MLASPGTRFTCGLRSTGSAWCWGLNERGQLGTGNTSHRGSTPPASAAPTTGQRLDSGGPACLRHPKHPASLWCWGEGRDGQLGIGKVGYRTVAHPRRHRLLLGPGQQRRPAQLRGRRRRGRPGAGAPTPPANSATAPRSTTRWHPTKVQVLMTPDRRRTQVMGVTLRAVACSRSLCAGALSRRPCAQPSVEQPAHRRRHAHVAPVAAKRVKIRIGTYNLNHDNHLVDIPDCRPTRRCPTSTLTTFQESHRRHSQVARRPRRFDETEGMGHAGW